VPTGGDDTQHFLQCSLGIDEVLQHELRAHEVHAVVLHRKVVGLRRLPLRIRMAIPVGGNQVVGNFESGVRPLEAHAEQGTVQPTACTAHLHGVPRGEGCNVTSKDHRRGVLVWHLVDIFDHLLERLPFLLGRIKLHHRVVQGGQIGVVSGHAGHPVEGTRGGDVLNG
jgi:hypothetical protein